MSKPAEQIWGDALLRLERELPRAPFESWIRQAKPLDYHDDTLVLGLTSQFARDLIESRFHKIVSTTVAGVIGRPIDLKLVAPETALVVEPLPLPATPKPAPESSGTPVYSPTLNPKYEFESFVVGNSNRLAHAASLAVADIPARAYNPLFLYGGVGLGKTHLMHAIGHQTLRRFPHMRVVYVSSETFTNEIINAIRDDKTAGFRNRYRTVDVLLIDDIQFLSGKERTQEEFFHTFEALHGANRQIVISSDRPPKEIPTLEERLRSRFEWGLITDIQPPDLETRIAILRKKALLESLEIPNDVVAFIASKIDTNIRELEGALIRLAAHAHLQSVDLTPESAAVILKDLLPATRPKKVTTKLIQEIVASYYNLTLEDFSAKKRSRAIAFPRQVAMFLCRSLTDASLSKIGEEFGGRDHTTVLHACEKVAGDAESDPHLRLVVEDLSRRVLSST